MPDAQITRTLGTCKTCRFFVLNPWQVSPWMCPPDSPPPALTAPNPTQGECRRNSPSKVVPSWPMVRSGAWCGKFAPVVVGFEKIKIPPGDFSPRLQMDLFPFDGFRVE